MPIVAFSYGFFAFFCFSKNSSFSPAPGVTKCLRPIFLRKRNFCDRLDYFLQAQFCCTDVTQINPRIPSIKFGHLQHWSQLSPNQNELSSGLGGRTALRLLIHSSMDSTALDLSHHCLSIRSIRYIYRFFYDSIAIRRKLPCRPTQGILPAQERMLTFRIEIPEIPPALNSDGYLYGG